ncbi:MAG TPA: carboxypeptidase-like regulatory domain-containing protein [Parafilimonas sp.]|nr:carboxypeptidase-like regulatory domain-containing protein [Parafilimonas sp.]
MAEPSTYHNYSFEDIQRYLQGKMSAAEMHELEKTALQDPFLADAIEGFNEADLATAKQHLNEINASLFAEKQRSKVVGFNKRTQWLNVAAVIIVLAGIGVAASYFIKSSTSNKLTEVAQVKNAAAKNEPAQDSSSAMANTNTLAKKEDTTLLIAENKAAKKMQQPVLKSKVPEAAVKEQDKEIAAVSAAAPPLNYDVTPAPGDTAGYVFKTNKPSTPEQTMVARSQTVADTPLLLSEQKSGLSVSPAVFLGKVVDEDNIPVPFAIIESGNIAKQSVADANGDFKLYQKDSLINVTVSAIGFNNRSVALKQGVNNPIILKSSSEGLNEVVVVGYGKRQRKAFADSVARVQEKTKSDSAMPVGGWNNFNNYVLTQLNTDTTADAVASTQDLVELEFLVDKTGSPYDIKITRSLNEQHNSKAVEILKNGPKWTNSSKKKKGRVVINFNPSH